MKSIKFLFFLTLFTLILNVFGTGFIFATEYQSLAPIQGIGDASGNVNIDDTTLENYFKTIYRMGIALATGLAVLMIVLGGIEYITTDAIGGKEEGKEKISNAIMGLLLALGSFIILRTIDPNLVSLNFNIKEVDQGKIKELAEGAGKFEFGDEGGVESVVGAQAPIVGLPDFNYYPNENTLPGLAEYRKNGPVAVRDNIGNPGTIDPTIAWMRDNVPGTFNWAVPSSTFRSAERNSQVGGSNSSAHLRGQAIDFYSKNNAGTVKCKRTEKIQSKLPIAEGEALVRWAIANAETLGLKQIIFNNKNYTTSNNWVGVDGGTNGLCHYDHVHIGR